MQKRQLSFIRLLFSFDIIFLFAPTPALGSPARDEFPMDFVFGAGTSAYQYEGAVNEDGRSPSIWDTYTHAGLMPDKSTGDVASDGYHKYEEDLELMSEVGLEAYRMSISWSRLIPNGKGPVNPKGLEYYNNVINGLTKRGIQIHITLYHLDLPQALEDEYGGWISPSIVEDFNAYADICFREFGDRVKHWTTINEPNVMGVACYDSGALPPNHCSRPFGVLDCAKGDSTVEPYIAVHNALLAHASVVALYRQKYQAKQKGAVGIDIYSYWAYPYSNLTADLEATERAKAFMYGWILEPLVFGDYPETMKKAVGARMPAFSANESLSIMGAIDFVGINHYTSVYISDGAEGEQLRDYAADMKVYYSVSKDGPPMGQFIPTKLASDPQGLRFMLSYLKETYQGIPIYIEENGYGQENDTIKDAERVEYIKSYMETTLQAISTDGVDVRGYFVWSFLDVFELLGGYSLRFGLYYVDFEDDYHRRLPKFSATWYSEFLKGRKTRLKARRSSIKSKFQAQM